MRNFYLVFGTVLALISFIFAMENMWLQSPAMFMFFKGTYIVGMLLMFMMIISLLSGFFFGLFFSSHKDEDSEGGDDMFQ